MAIAFDAATNGGSTVGTSLTYSHTTTGSERLLVVSVGALDATDTVTGITYAGTSLIKVAARAPAVNPWFFHFYFLTNPASGANNVVVTKSASSFMTSLAASYTGVFPITVPDAEADSSPVGETLNQSLTTVAPGCWSILMAYGGGVSPTAGANTTMRIQEGGFQTGFYDSNAAKTPPGSVTLGITQTGNAESVLILASFAPPQIQTFTSMWPPPDRSHFASSWVTV